MTLAPELLQAVVHEYFAASRSEHKVDRMVACFAPTSISYDPAEGKALTGQEELRQFFQGITQVFETVALHEEFISINGQEAAVKWTGHGVGKNGRTIRFEGIDLFAFNAEGKIQSMRAYWNPAAMLAEIQGAN